MKWRDIARPIIARILMDHEGKDEKVIRAALRAGYPWGERAMHPYKIWLDEIKVQMGKRRFGQKTAKNNPDQPKLF